MVQKGILGSDPRTKICMRLTVGCAETGSLGGRPPGQWAGSYSSQLVPRPQLTEAGLRAGPLDGGQVIPRTVQVSGGSVGHPLGVVSDVDIALLVRATVLLV